MRTVSVCGRKYYTLWYDVPVRMPLDCSVVRLIFPKPRMAIFEPRPPSFVGLVADTGATGEDTHQQ